MKLVVGLGNPEEKYKNNRHNVGFILVDKLAVKRGCEWSSSAKNKCLLSVCGDLILIKPQTFMNESGTSVSKVRNFYKIEPFDISVVHDDLDLELGVVKKQFGAGSAGHHGVEDIIEKLGTKEFWRIRIGIGRPQSEYNDPTAYVLQDFSSGELAQIQKIDLEPFI